MGKKKQSSSLPLPGSLGIYLFTELHKKIPDGLLLNMLHEGEMTSAMLLQIVGLLFLMFCRFKCSHLH